MHVLYSRIKALPSHLQCYLQYLSEQTGFRFALYCGGRNEDNNLELFTYATIVLSDLL